jgi:chitinase
MNRRDGTAENWLIAFTQTLRQQLPQGQYIITHAPVAPWFAGALYTSGAYATVNAKVGNLIDWYNIQFYNQGTTEYTTCAGLLTQSSSTWPNSAVFQIAAGGVPLNKIVIGKPSTPGDATGGAGYIDPNTLASCLQQAKAQGWSAGAMFWQFPHATSSFIATVRALSWPVGSSPPPPPPSTTITPTPTSSPHSTTPTSTPTGGSGQCSGVAAWTSGVAYNGGTKVRSCAPSKSNSQLTFAPRPSTTATSGRPNGGPRATSRAVLRATGPTTAPAKL